MRIILFGDGAWAAKSLLALSKVDCELAGVVLRNRPSDSSLEDEARNLCSPVFQTDNVNSEEFVELVRKLAPDLCLSISYNQILRPPILDAAQLGFVNFHAGKLPYYRGRNVINWAIINGETEIGLTAHVVDEGIDTGDIVLQRMLPIFWTDTYGDVLHRVVDHFPSFVVEVLQLFVSGRVTRLPQSHLQGTYFTGREDGDEWLDWSDTSLNLYNKVRAITRPGPGARTLLGDRVLTIWRAGYDPSWPKYLATPGQVAGRGPEGVVVKTGDSTLLLQEVQLAGGEPHRPAFPIGTRFGVNIISCLGDLLNRIKTLESRAYATGGNA